MASTEDGLMPSEVGYGEGVPPQPTNGSGGVS